MEPMIAQHVVDDSWNGVTAELMDTNAELWSDTEQGMVHLDFPEKGKMLRVTVSGRAVFYVSDDRKVLLDHDMS